MSDLIYVIRDRSTGQYLRAFDDRPIRLGPYHRAEFFDQPQDKMLATVSRWLPHSDLYWVGPCDKNIEP